jgi:predicted acetyltransferase
MLKRRSSQDVFFSNKKQCIVVQGGKGTSIIRSRKSVEYNDVSKNVGHTVINNLNKDVAITLLECGFSQSVHPTIRSCVRRTHPFEDVETWGIKLDDSLTTVDGVCSHRRVQVEEDITMFEVLFVSVHPQSKRSGVGRLIAQRLLEKASGNKSKYNFVTVSLKSNSSEAAHFWKTVGLDQFSVHTSDLHAKIIKSMVYFDDFTPFCIMYD